MTLAFPKVEARERFATSSLETTVKDAQMAYRLSNSLCRVCNTPIRGGFDAYRSRQWGVEYAHEGCGWLTQEEKNKAAPIEVRRPGTSFSHWMVECPTCGLDSCRVRKPREGDPLECRRCRPVPELAPGVLVETLRDMTVKPLRERQPMLTFPAYARARVLRLETPIEAGGMATVRISIAGPQRRETLIVRPDAIGVL